ncbi:MAG: hypothetical protein ABWW69_05020 [Pyrodictiaceae archaeon]
MEAVGRLEDRIVDLYQRILGLIEKRDNEKNFRVPEPNRPLFESLIEQLKETMVYYVLGVDDINEARRWINELFSIIEFVKNKLGAKGIVLSKELASFVEDPLRHLKKKLFIYTHDLVRGRLDLASYIRTSMAALRTSYRTNMRSIYQSWVFLALLSLVGLRIIYPEHGFPSIDRSGKQRSGTIPPNIVVETRRGGLLSFFLEAPRPIGWEDEGDLARSWRLYTALRPDILVYGGFVDNIVDLRGNPPIRRPDVIVECKELEDWYLRYRDIRGPFAKPLTAEEWRAKWIEGLWTGLADALGVEREQLAAAIKERRTMRLREYKIVVLYKRLYNPRRMYLVSRMKIPGDVRSFLESEGITVVDGVGFSAEKLREVALELEEYAHRDLDAELSLLPAEVAKLILEIIEIFRRKGVSKSVSEVLIEALKAYRESIGRR